MPRYTNDADFSRGIANLAELMFGNAAKDAKAGLWRSQLDQNAAQAQMQRAHGNKYQAEADGQVWNNGLVVNATDRNSQYFDGALTDALVLGSNYDQLMKGKQQGVETDAYKSVLSGDLSADRFGSLQGANKGNQRYGVQGDTLINLYDGGMQTTELGNSKILGEKAQANQRNAAAGKETAHAGLYRQQTTNEQRELANMTPGADGIMPKDQSNQSATSKYNPKANASGADGDKPLTTLDITRAKLVVDKALPGLKKQFDMGDDALMAISARAQKYVAEKKLSPEEAIEIAVAEMKGGGQLTTESSYFGNDTLKYSGRSASGVITAAPQQNPKAAAPVAQAAAAKDGQSVKLSKSGRPMIQVNGQWVYQ